MDPLKVISFIGLIIIVIFDYYYPVEIRFLNREIYLNQYLVFIIIISFGLFRVLTEKETYQKFRITAILGFYLLFWSPLPALFGIKSPLLEDIHTVGTLLFFLYFIPVLLIGKRADCGWNCICVTVRETAGFAFREDTLKGPFWWKLRYLKIILFILMAIYLSYMIIDPSNSYNKAGKPFYGLVTHTYYLSFLLLPIMGNRNYCRFLCPYSALWGILSRLGFYKIKADVEKCIDCKLCEKSCDMGIPINHLVKTKGEVNTIECMGCGRCVRICPEGVLSIYDIRDVLLSKKVKKPFHLSKIVSIVLTLVYFFGFPSASHAVRMFDGIKASPGTALYELWPMVYHADTLTDKDGDKIHPGKDFNLTLSQLLIVPIYYYTENFGFGLFIPVNKIKNGYLGEESEGLGDVILSSLTFLPEIWGGTYSIDFGIKFPTGNFDKDKSVNPGSGQMDIETGMYYFQYFGEKKRFTADAKAVFKYRFKNTDIDWNPGEEYQAEGLIGYEILKDIRLGIGFDWMKSENDRINGHADGNSAGEKISANYQIYYNAGPKIDLWLQVLQDHLKCWFDIDVAKIR
ncbi:MAG: transporter [Thermodesulfobacteriota bacterium]|nr:transporter [Thermodesulfobacteriota bacterium]